MAYLNCGHCGLEMKIGTSSLASQNCPRCLARNGAIVTLQLRGRPRTATGVAPGTARPDDGPPVLAPAQAPEAPSAIPAALKPRVVTREVEGQRLAGGRPGRTAPGPPRFAVGVRPNRRAVHLEPAGELDLATAPTLYAHVAELLERGFNRLVIDLRGVVFIDSAGVHLLLTLDGDASRQGWQLTLIPGPDPVQRLFVLTGSLHRLPFSPAGTAVALTAQPDAKASATRPHPADSARWAG